MNFEYLSNLTGFKTLYKNCKDAEDLVYLKPNLSVVSARQANEFLVKLLYEANVGSSFGLTTLDMLKHPTIIKLFDDNKIVLDSMHEIRKKGNAATHQSNLTDEDSIYVLEVLTFVVGEILISINQINDYPNFIDPKNILTPSQTSKVVPQIEEEVEVPEELVFELGPKLKNIHFKFDAKKQDELKRAFFKGLLREANYKISKVDGSSFPSSVNMYMLLDDGSKIDYTINGKNGKPLAVIEFDADNLLNAKKKVLDDVDKLMKTGLFDYRPVAYYTDGFEIHIIDQLGFKARRVSGFHTESELERLIQRQGNIADISTPVIDKTIAGRKYQEYAITSICKAFNSKRRKSLIVLATGTGKTRVSVALVDVLSKAGWAKNVLFLADRKSLVRQANKAFKDMLPHITTALYCGDSNEKDPTANVVFSTYNSMINLISSEHKEFSMGRFDLIIIDEAHRSIFDKFGAIFDYFDAMMLGLTATPRGENNKSTYDVFELQKDHPDYYYELEEAVNDGWLVGFAIKDKTTLALRRKIKYGDLSDDEKAKIEEAEEIRGDEPEEHSDDETIELGARLVNIPTIDLMLHSLMDEGLKVENNEKIGKTIIFAKGHKEAEIIVERFRTIYNYLPKDFIKLIDYASEEDSEILIDNFKVKENLPQIAVSVDMLDTGIDVPEILNLVFFKPMQSKIKFLQMIGRGTRLCKDLFGPGMDKIGFFIFDYYDNFNYFSQDDNPWSTIGSPIPSISARSVSYMIYKKRLGIAATVQTMNSPSGFEEKYKDEIIKELSDITMHLNDEDIGVKYNMTFVQKFRDITSWNDLDCNGGVIVEHVLDLFPPIPGDVKIKNFDSLMYSCEQELISWEDSGEGLESLEKHLAKWINRLNKYVRKLIKRNNEDNIPALNKKIKDISDLKDGGLLLDNPSTEKYEDIRKKLRDVMFYLPDEQEFVILEQDDEEIDKTQEDPSNKPYDEKAEAFIKANEKHPVFVKMRMIEKLDQSDIDALKNTFFSQIGTESEFKVWSNGKELLPFIRYQVGIDDGAVASKFGSFLNPVVLTKDQLDFCNALVDYVKQNGDILPNVLSKEPVLSKAYVNCILGTGAVTHVKTLINVLHDAIAEK